MFVFPSSVCVRPTFLSLLENIFHSWVTILHPQLPFKNFCVFIFCILVLLYILCFCVVYFVCVKVMSVHL